jgi:hypothetical protein
MKKWTEDAGDFLQRTDVAPHSALVTQIRDQYFIKLAPKKPYLELLRLQHEPVMHEGIISGVHAQLGKMDEALIIYNGEAAQALIKAGLPEKDAIKLQGTIIRHCISAFQKTFRLERGEGVRVPKLIPESGGITR